MHAPSPQTPCAPACLPACSQAQKDFGACDAEFMKKGNYCLYTCGRCPSGSTQQEKGEGEKKQVRREAVGRQPDTGGGADVPATAQAPLLLRSSSSPSCASVVCFGGCVWWHQGDSGNQGGSSDQGGSGKQGGSGSQGGGAAGGFAAPGNPNVCDDIQPNQQYTCQQQVGVRSVPTHSSIFSALKLAG